MIKSFLIKPIDIQDTLHVKESEIQSLAEIKSSKEIKSTKEINSTKEIKSTKSAEEIKSTQSKAKVIILKYFTKLNLWNDCIIKLIIISMFTR